MSMDWFRWYHGTVSDPKLALIAKKSGQPRSVAIAIWAALLEQASQAESRGNISDFDVETIAVALDIDDDAIHSTIAAMIAKGMIADQPAIPGLLIQLYFSISQTSIFST